jgi:septum site-determining protein MinC
MQLKGIGNNLTVLLDPKQPPDDLKEELRRIFDPLKHLSADARIVLDTGDQGGHEELVRELGAFLKTHYKIDTVTEPPRERAAAAAATVATKERWRQKEMEGGLFHRPSEVLMMTGLVRSGQKITARKHFLLMGDLNPGSEVIASGDILILGSLRGKAIAGHPDNDGALILALDFRPTQIQIGGFVAAGLPTPKAGTAEFAHVQNGAIVVDDYLKTNPFGGLPWPEVR